MTEFDGLAQTLNIKAKYFRYWPEINEQVANTVAGLKYTADVSAQLSPFPTPACTARRGLI